MEPDEQLVKIVLSGNQDAFAELVRRYEKLVFAICFNITGHRQEAENLAQETFIQVYRSLSRYEYKGFKTWIGRIATNKSIDWKRKKNTGSENKVVYLDDIPEVGSENFNIQDQLLRKESREKVRKICKNLPQKYSVIIKKFYMQSKTYSQISEEEGISVRTVETRLYRARQEIRRKLEEESYDSFE
ncbi:MAG: sigma-70 family RNA polymerase sigma factor [Clostridiaceae bacterium]|nr:sigma-70 family RNA polymerase sigma factor [Clostridiaceae bacterium]